MSWLFISGGQNIAASASASVLPVNVQDSFPLGLTGLISLLSKGFSRVFSRTTVQKHQFFGTQPIQVHVSIMDSESPLDGKETQPVILKEISPEYSLEGPMLKFQYFGQLM